MFFSLDFLVFLTFDECRSRIQNDVELIHEIEANLGKKLEIFECKENEVLENVTKVCFGLFPPNMIDFFSVLYAVCQLNFTTHLI